jgi:hypothetical protein
MPGIYDLPVHDENRSERKRRKKQRNNEPRHPDLLGLAGPFVMRIVLRLLPIVVIPLEVIECHEGMVS